MAFLILTDKGVSARKVVVNTDFVEQVTEGDTGVIVKMSSGKQFECADTYADLVTALSAVAP